MSRFAAATLLALATIACGGAQPAAPAPPAANEQHEIAGEEHHAGTAPAISAFHDVLAPLWHADAGAMRTDDTCAAIPRFRDLAGDIITTVPPREDSDA